MTRLKILAALVVVGSGVVIAGCAPGPNAKCPNFAVSADTGKNGPNTATFTLTPARDGFTYNWSLTAGTISDGQGTPAIVVSDPNAGETVTATVEVGGLDASCPAGSNIVSGSAKMP